MLEWPLGDRLVWSATSGNIRFGDDGSCYVFNPTPNAGVWLAAYAATGWAESGAMATVSALLSLAAYRVQGRRSTRLVGAVAFAAAVAYMVFLLARYNNAPLIQTSTASADFQGAIPMPFWGRSLFTMRLVLDPMYTVSLFLSICLACLAVGCAATTIKLDHGRCVKCGYDLTGNVSGICPECGTPVLTG